MSFDEGLVPPVSSDGPCAETTFCTGTNLSKSVSSTAMKSNALLKPSRVFYSSPKTRVYTCSVDVAYYTKNKADGRTATSLMTQLSSKGEAKHIPQTGMHASKGTVYVAGSLLLSFEFTT